MVLLTSQLRVAVRAVQRKLRLLTAYDTLWPAAAQVASCFCAAALANSPASSSTNSPTPATMTTVLPEPACLSSWPGTSWASAATITSS